jgi:hypothetical protein
MLKQRDLLDIDAAFLAACSPRPMTGSARTR